MKQSKLLAQRELIQRRATKILFLSSDPIEKLSITYQTSQLRLSEKLTQLASLKEASLTLKQINEMCEPSDFYSFIIVDSDLVSPKVPLKKLIMDLREQLYATKVTIHPKIVILSNLPHKPSVLTELNISYEILKPIKLDKF